MLERSIGKIVARMHEELRAKFGNVESLTANETVDVDFSATG